MTAAFSIVVGSPLLVHELQPKDWLLGSGGWTRHHVDF